MSNIVIRIRDRRAVLLTQSYIVNGNTDYVIEFDFDSEWDEFAEKTARFVYCDKQGARHWIDVPITDNTCNAPKLERVDRVEVGVYAGSIRTTTAALIPCIRCITDLRGQPYHPPDDVYAQLMERVARAESGLPELPDGYCFVVASDGSYIVTAEGDYIIAKE